MGGEVLGRPGHEVVPRSAQGAWGGTLPGLRIGGVAGTVHVASCTSHEAAADERCRVAADSIRCALGRSATDRLANRCAFSISIDRATTKKRPLSVQHGESKVHPGGG
jgi:hypothetical protein